MVSVITTYLQNKLQPLCRAGSPDTGSVGDARLCGVTAPECYYAQHIKCTHLGRGANGREPWKWIEISTACPDVLWIFKCSPTVTPPGCSKFGEGYPCPTPYASSSTKLTFSAWHTHQVIDEKCKCKHNTILSGDLIETKHSHLQKWVIAQIWPSRVNIGHAS